MPRGFASGSATGFLRGVLETELGEERDAAAVVLRGDSLQGMSSGESPDAPYLMLCWHQATSLPFKLS